MDANLLVYAVDEQSPDHHAARSWLEARLSGRTRVGLPWASLLAFTRIVTLPRLVANPLEPREAWSFVEGWLDADPAWIPAPTPAHRQVVGELIARHRAGGNLVPDAHLAALALEHGVEVCSADSDFARFTEIRWRNPLR